MEAIHTYQISKFAEQERRIAHSSISNLTTEWQRWITQFVGPKTNCSLDSVLMRSG